MRQLVLRKWHRYVGLSLMPLFIVQVISGFVLIVVDTLGFIERTPAGSAVGIAILVTRKLPAFLSPYDDLMMSLHFAGGSLPGGIVRILVTTAFVWVMFSGLSIFLSTRALTRQRQ